ncbi:type II toxin-antitoxin system VapC family toxin [Candidatus Woesearchaeota archaeon]|nr:type II toxin-antitoxin system VapC family toxin [Candidatus Woesearchaeota archaeon]
MGKETFIDANIFLEIFFDDYKAEECERFLKSLETNDEIGITTDFLVYACLIGIENRFKDYKKLENALVFFTSCPNLRILIPSFDELEYAIKISKAEKLDFDDSLVVACMNSHGITELASLDRHFDKAKGIKRIEL